MCTFFVTVVINMPILYSVVARGPIILAKHAACVGNFEEVTAKILAKIPPDNDKLTYSQGPYLFHYICEDRLIYMCITDDVCVKYVEINFVVKCTMKFYCRIFKDPGHFYILMKLREGSWLFMDQVLKLP